MSDERRHSPCACVRVHHIYILNIYAHTTIIIHHSRPQSSEKCPLHIYIRLHAHEFVASFIRARRRRSRTWTMSPCLRACTYEKVKKKKKLQKEKKIEKGERERDKMKEQLSVRGYCDWYNDVDDDTVVYKINGIMQS